MKVSKLIEKLQALELKHGDVEVEFLGHYNSFKSPAITYAGNYGSGYPPKVQKEGAISIEGKE